MPPPAVPAPMPGRPVGKVRSPGLVLLLTLVTLGIYSLAWWWSVSKEIDAHIQRRHAHPVIRLGVPLEALGLVAYLLGFFLFFGALGAAETGKASFGGTGLAGFVLILLGGIAVLGGFICILVGGWRIWSVLRSREQALGARNPLGPGWQLALMLIPYVNLVGVWVVLYRTQSHLNAMWQNRIP